jgi:hypothetical protein
MDPTFVVEKRFYPYLIALFRASFGDAHVVGQTALKILITSWGVMFGTDLRLIFNQWLSQVAAHPPSWSYAWRSSLDQLHF